MSDGSVYVILGGWHTLPRNIVVRKCNSTLSTCSDVLTGGPAVEDFYCCFPQGGKLWFSGKHGTNGGIVGYYDPSANTITHMYTGDTAYQKYVMLIAYNNKYGKWLFYSVGDSGWKLYTATNPLDKSTWTDVTTQITSVVQTGLKEVKPTISRNTAVMTALYPNLIIRVYLFDVSEDWSTFSNGRLVYQTPQAGPNNWISYVSGVMCGRYLWVGDARVDNASSPTTIYMDLVKVDPSTGNYTVVDTVSGPVAGSETQPHVFCLFEKYVMFAAVQSSAWGKINIYDLNGNLLWSTDYSRHVEFINTHYGNMFGVPGQAASANGVEVGVIRFDETSPFLNVSVSGTTISVSGAYPNSTVRACRAHSYYGDQISILSQYFDKCVSATADANGNATITVDETGGWIIVS